MNRRLIALLLAGLCLAQTACVVADEYEDYDDDDDVGAAGGGGAVAVLTNDNFDEFLAENNHVLVEFYAPWCGHCKALEPKYEEAAQNLELWDEEGMGVPAPRLAKVDVTENDELGKRFGIEGFPTLKFFVGGEFSEDYPGAREADAIEEWVASKAGPATQELKTPAELKSAEKMQSSIVVGYFPVVGEEGDENYSDFVTAASLGGAGLKAYETSDAATAAAAGLETYGVSIVRNWEGLREVVVMDAAEVEGTVAGLSQWLKDNSAPDVIPFNQETGEMIFGSGINYQIIAVGSDEALAGVMDTLRAVGKALRGKLIMVGVSTSDPETARAVVDFFKLEGSKDVEIRGFYMESNRKYGYEGAITVDDLTAFANSLLDGSAEPIFQSAPIPTKDKDGHVQIVVGKTMDSIVLDPTKDVLLEIYAPWCGHCKQLAPIYKKLAKRFKNVDSMVIAKFDGTENEHSTINVEGFPTLLFFPAEEGAEPIPMDGDRTLAAMTKWLKAHAKIPYELPKKAEDGKAEDAGHDEL